jgi:hypothetical protein
MRKKRKKPKQPLKRPGDLQHTIAVVDWALAENLQIWRPSAYQLKIGPWNYYPTNKAFNSDANPAKKHSGFSNFKEAVLKAKPYLMAIDLDD